MHHPHHLPTPHLCTLNHHPPLLPTLCLSLSQNHFPRFLILSHLNTLPSLPTNPIPSSITQSLTTLPTLNLSHTTLLLSPSLPTLLILSHTPSLSTSHSPIIHRSPITHSMNLSTNNLTPSLTMPLSLSTGMGSQRTPLSHQ